MKLYKQEASGRTEEVDEGFNWAACLFGFFWYAYKGMWGLAFINFFAVLVIYAFLGTVGALIYWFFVGFIANGQYEDSLVSKGWHVQQGKKKGKKEKEDKGGIIKGTPLATKIVLIGVFAIIVLFFTSFAYKFMAVSAEKTAVQKCLDIQNDPALKYPCKCVPTTRPDNPTDAVDAKSNSMCTCECDLGASGKKVIEVK